MVLLMLGLFGILLILSQRLSNHIKENVQIVMFFDDDITSEEVHSNISRINSSEYVKSSHYLTKEQAAQEYSREIGQDFVSFLGYNPLLPSIQLNLKAEFANAEKMNSIEQELKGLTKINEVSYPKSIFEQIDQNIKTIGLTLIILAFLFVIIAVSLINNTVRLHLYARRFLIKSMQLVGATRWFIIKPFVISAIFHGLWGAIISIGLVLTVVYALPHWIPEIVQLYDTDAFIFLFAFLLVLGILISLLSSWWSTSRYLKTKIEDLY